MISPDLLEAMACPLCKAALDLQEQKLLCKNADCGCRYAISDDIPIMLIDEAERPCPGCGAQRKWEPEQDTLRCEKCARTFRPAPEPGPATATPAAH